MPAVVSIRPATEADYPVLAELWSMARPDATLSAEELRHEDSSYVDPYRLVRFVAEQGEWVVGEAAFRHSIGSFHPRRFLVEVKVFPEARGRGIGGALWSRLRAELASLEPLALRTTVRDDDPAGLRFARRRGFVETKRDTLSTLDLGRFARLPVAASSGALARAGVRIVSLAELEAAGVTWRRPWYDLFAEVRRDVPRSEPPVEIAYERFARLVYTAPDFRPDLALVALHEVGREVRWIARTELFGSGGRDLYNGMTGVVRDWRRRGLALTLKVAVFERAAALGFARVHTDNDARNVGMLAINERLGFVAGASLLSMLLEPVPAP